MLDSAETLARKHFLLIAALLDANEPKFVEGRVEIPGEAKAALRAQAEAGFFALGFDEADGGLQAPTVTC
jgi:butyryl-CoA dehydrogenase